MTSCGFHFVDNHDADDVDDDNDDELLLWDGRSGKQIRSQKESSVVLPLHHGNILLRGNSICILFISSERLGIFQLNFESQI